MGQTNATDVTEKIAADSQNERPLNDVKNDEKSSKRKTGLGRDLEIELDLKNHFFPRT